MLVLSQHVETPGAVDLVVGQGGFGYLLKDRVLDVDEFLDAAERVAARRLGARPAGRRLAGRARAPTTGSPSSPSASARCSR